MDVKRRRIIWFGAAILFILAVASGYWPDLMLARELSAAKAEGLGPVDRKPPAVPADQDARKAYDLAIRRNMPGENRLTADPMKEARHPGPDVRKLLDAVAEASWKTAYVVPYVSPDERANPALRPWPDVESQLDRIASAFVTSARSPDDLETAARIANHLRNDDPAAPPFPFWGRLAVSILTAADRDHLPAATRARLVLALGPRPDPIALLKRHVTAVLGKLDRAKTPAMARREASYIGFWRGFIRTVPREPQAFAAAIAAAEPKIVAAEQGVDIYQTYGTSVTATQWKDWAGSLANALRRLD